mgnify:CR=1 FL=1
MKLLKTKFPPQPENRFQEFLQKQPVFNWFDRYADERVVHAGNVAHGQSYENWLAKRVES